jgi:transposase-like protein
MTQHFLLSAAARTLSVLEVASLSDDAAFALFERLRWGDREEVGCPHCGLVHKHYFRPARQIWRCAGCGDDFSVTSGTIFAFHKLPLRVYLVATILFANAVKGLSALQMARDLGVQHKTAYVLLHKLLDPAVHAELEAAREWRRNNPAKATDLAALGSKLGITEE